MDTGENIRGNEYADVTFLEVGKEYAEPVRRKLLQENILRFDSSIITKGDMVCFPIYKGIPEEQLFSVLRLYSRNFSISVSRVLLKPKKINSFRDLIDIPEEFLEFLPSSWDVVGDIIFVKLSDEILSFKTKISQALLAAHGNIRSVYWVKKISGDCRIRELEHIGGDENTVTAAKEFGIIMNLDVAKVYYSPRLATERWRIAQQVSEGELVLDMFTGIGPFSLVISRHARPSSIHSIDINPEAIRYLETNIKLNRIENIEYHLGDAVEICKSLSDLYKFDRIIMNLPHSSLDFFEIALACSKIQTKIHLYVIRELSSIDDMVDDCIASAGKQGCQISEKARVTVRSYSPSEANVCVDFSVDDIR